MSLLSCVGNSAKSLVATIHRLTLVDGELFQSAAECRVLCLQIESLLVSLAMVKVLPS